MMNRILGTSTLGIVATLPSFTEGADVKIAYDCWQETARAYGSQLGTKVSDKSLVTGLDPTKHKLVGVSACTDM